MSAGTWTDEDWRPSGESRSCLFRRSAWPGEPLPAVSSIRGVTVIFHTLSTAAGMPEPMEPIVPWDSFDFHHLVKQWHEQRDETSSSISEVIACPAHLRIIAMGRRALPLIIEQLKSEEDEPDHWCAALEAITGENPVPEDAHGDTVRIAQAWIEWSETSWILRALDQERNAESQALRTLSTTALPGLPGPIHVGGGPVRAALPEVTGLSE